MQAWAAEQAESAWQSLTIREGEEGAIRADYLHARVWLWDGVESNARHWHLLVRREFGVAVPSHYCLSNALPSIPMQELARVQAQRFFIEHAFREAKSECSMVDYQVRRWDSWHHYMILVMLATLFLVKQKEQHRKTWPMLTLNDIVTAIAHMLPKRQMTSAELAHIITQRHNLHESAKRSHSKKHNVAKFSSNASSCSVDG